MSDFRSEKRRQDAIGRTLRKMYDDVVNEGDTPDEFLDILRSSRAGASPDKNPPSDAPKSGGKD